jgi:peptidyl-prolyl cis-trans isomerase C
MKSSTKVIVVVAVVAALALGGLWAQNSSSSSKAIKLSGHDMGLIVGDNVPPEQQQQFESDPEQKKQVAKRIKQVLAVGQFAEAEGYARRPDVQLQVALQQDLVLAGAYNKKFPNENASDEDIAAFYAANPSEFDNFISSNPRFQQAQGPQRESLKKQYGEIKVLSTRARKEGFDQEEAMKLKLLVQRFQVLAGAYVNELQKNSDKLVTDADVEGYYNEHPQEFEEVHARHILISTAPPDQPTDMGDKGKKDADKKPKTVNKEEARQKAQSLLDRIRKGEDFVKLANEYSEEPGAKSRGGDLGYFAKDAMVPQFSNVAFALKPGDVSDIVETEFGYHIIKVEDHRTAPLTDDKVRQQIVGKLKQKKIEDKIEEITNQSNVEVAEDFSINAPAPNQSAIPGASPAPATKE